MPKRLSNGVSRVMYNNVSYYSLVISGITQYNIFRPYNMISLKQTHITSKVKTMYKPCITIFFCY